MPIKLFKILRLLLIGFLLCLSGFTNSAVDPIILDHNTQQVALGNYAYYLEDINGDYSLYDIVELDNSNFELLTEESLNKGFTHSTYWLKFSIVDRTLDKKTQSWKLETTYPLLDYIDIYIVDENKKNGIWWGSELKWNASGNTKYWIKLEQICG